MDNQSMKMVFVVLLLVALVAVVGMLLSKGPHALTSAVISGEVVCWEDKNCDDGISATEDICKNPGTEFSICINRPIR